MDFLKSITGKTIKLLPFQQKIISKIKRGKDYLLCGPTGSGKTIMAYHYCGLLDPVEFHTNYHKVIICSPIKALSNERYLELKSAGVDVGLETGDNKVNEGARVLCVTQEIYLLKYCNIKNCRVIIDEIHYMFSEDSRSKAYMDSIYKTSASSNLMLLSATIRNPKEFCNFLNDLTGRDFNLITWEDRPVPLTFNTTGIDYKRVKDSIIFAFSVKDIEEIVDILVKKRKERKHTEDIDCIVFYWQVESNFTWYYGISPYYGAMLPKEKHCIEELFREGCIDTIVGTDALALGVNLPAKQVVFSSLVKQEVPITASLFKQLSGRAGRYGYHSSGIVTYLKDRVSKKVFESYVTKKVEKTKILPSIDISSLLNGKTVSDEFSEIEKYYYVSGEDIHSGLSWHLDKCFKQFNCCIDQLESEKLEVIESGKNLRFYDEFLTRFKQFYLSELDFNSNLLLHKIISKYIDNRNRLDCRTVVDSIFEENTFSCYSHSDGKTIRFLLLLRRLFNGLNGSMYKIDNLDYPEHLINSLDLTVLNLE